MSIPAYFLELNQRPLSRGELVILAKVLSERLPLIDEGTDNVELWVTSQKSAIAPVMDVLYRYTYISPEDRDFLFLTLKQFCMWRSRVATGTFSMRLSGNPETVIDDLSGLLWVVDRSAMCAITDIAAKAGVAANAFYQLCSNSLGTKE